jgi:hypothetical protein
LQNCFAGQEVALALTEDWRHGAIDATTGSRVRVKSTPDQELLAVEYTAPAFARRFNASLSIRLKYPDRPCSNEEPLNPGLMLSSPTVDGSLLSHNMRDIEKNTELVERMIRMIAFINRNYPLSQSPFLWSDAYQRSPSRFRIPSDEALLAISLDPEAG